MLRSGEFGMVEGNVRPEGHEGWHRGRVVGARWVEQGRGDGKCGQVRPVSMGACLQKRLRLHCEALVMPFVSTTTNEGGAA